MTVIFKNIKARFAFVAWAIAIGLSLAVTSAESSASVFAKSNQEPDITVSLKTDQKNQQVIFITGIDQNEPSPLIKVWLKSANPNNVPPLAGKATKSPTGWDFQPRFPLRAGKVYRVRIRIGNDLLHDYYLSTPAADQTPAKVTAVFPSNNRIPANALKFYVHFATPMEKGNVYQYLSLQKADGTEIELPFLEIEQEFWSRDSLRLTLLLDPGRIKRRLKPREQMGPIFEAGGKYELVVGGEWPDGNGVKLGADFVKTYLATDDDYLQPDPKNWKFKLPSANSVDPITIAFNEALDHSMLQHAIEVLNSSGVSIDGTYFPADDSKSLVFTPKQPWQAGTYQLAIATNLEDLAGNSIGRQFDVDVFDKTEPTNRDEVVLRSFKIEKK